jgi:hypothetical protein
MGPPNVTADAAVAATAAALTAAKAHTHRMKFERALFMAHLLHKRLRADDRSRGDAIS